MLQSNSLSSSAGICWTCKKEVPIEFLGKMSGRMKKYRSCKDCISKRGKNFLRYVKAVVMKHYGGDPPRCSCCGESIFEFLEIHHVNGDGAKQRRQLNCRAGKVFYSWLIKNNFPPGLSVLCANCNKAESLVGMCPHRRGQSA